MAFSPYKTPVLSGVMYLFIVVVGALPTTLFGQDIEEVVVQAERQNNSTMDLTESVDAFDLEDLETHQIAGFADISNVVPGLTASPSGAQGLRFTLRGIGARDSQLGVESKVGLYVDGAFLGRASGLVFDIVDLESVEVLKGPQGFTYGRNAIGGTINLITAKASVEEFYGKIDIKVGNFARRNVTGIVNVPISDTFALRASAFTNQADGWVENKGRGVDWGGYDRTGFRIAARWHASESVTVDYAYDRADFVTQPVFYQPQFIEGEQSFDKADYDDVPGNIATFLSDANGSLIFQTPLGAGRLDEGGSTLREIENSTTDADGHSLVVEWGWSELHTLKLIGTYRTSEVNNTFYFFPDVSSATDLQSAIRRLPRKSVLESIEGGLLFSASPVSPGSSVCTPDAIAAPPTAGFLNLSVLGISEALGTAAGQAYYDALAFEVQNPVTNPECGPTANFLALLPQAVGLYRVGDFFSSVFSSPPGGLAALRDHKQFSIELRQAGSFLDDRLEYIAGVYYFNERTGNGQTLNNNDGTLDIATELYLDVVELLDFGSITGTDVNNFGFSFISLNRLNTDALGLYSDFVYTPLWLDERLHVTLGVRYSRDERSLERQGLQSISLEPRGDLQRESGIWESVDPRFKLAYDITEDVIGYLSITSGFRGGNFNVDARDIPPQVGQAASAGIEFDEESQIAYEVGLKGPFFNGLVDMELAMFYYDIKDGQETVIFPTSPISRAVVNADGYAFGIEADTTWHFTDELSFTANWALLRSGSDSYITPFAPDFSVLVESLGRPLDPTDNEYRQLIAQCSGGLRRPNFALGQCLERKSNFGAPVSSWQTSLDYRLPTNYGEFFFHLGYSYKDAFFVNDTLKVDSRNVWELRVQTQFDTDSGVARVALWSQNLFDNEYQVQKFELNAIALDIASYGQPRTFGINVIYEWL